MPAAWSSGVTKPRKTARSAHAETLSTGIADGACQGDLSRNGRGKIRSPASAPVALTPRTQRFHALGKCRTAPSCDPDIGTGRCRRCVQYAETAMALSADIPSYDECV